MVKKRDRISVQDLLMISRGCKQTFWVTTVSAVCTARSLASQYADRGKFTLKSEPVNDPEGKKHGYIVEIFREKKEK